MRYYTTVSGLSKPQRPALPFDAAAARRRALSLRGNCRRHGEYRLNVLRNGQVTANGCPDCYPTWARR